MLGLGGSHLIHAGRSEAESEALVEVAMASGIRFVDTAQQYGGGESERRLGLYLTPKYRDVVYLMTKTQATEATGARRDVEECRKRLGVDVIDLMQIHHIESPEAVDQRIDAGVLDVLLEAREQGKIRHLGFTGHDTPRAHLRMLERLDKMGVQLDTVQMPINVVDPGYESFILGVLPELVKRDYGVLAMKTLAFGQITGQNTSWKRGRESSAPAIVPEQMSLDEALGFAWSLPVSTLISGMPVPEQIRQNAAMARAFTAFDEARRQALVDKAAPFAGPEVEFYKRWERGGGKG